MGEQVFPERESGAGSLQVGVIRQAAWGAGIEEENSEEVRGLRNPFCKRGNA